jgi:hypothetical protein
MIKKFLRYKLEKTPQIFFSHIHTYTNLPHESTAITASHKLRFRKLQKAEVTKVKSWLVITKWYQVKIV